MKPDNPKDLYNHIASKYSANRSKASNDITELPAVLRLAGNLKDKKVLDVGCGLGKHAKQFLDQGADVTGFDASEEMIKICEETCEGKGNFFVGDLETVSFEPKSFDFINASMVMMYVENVPSVFKKVHEWLKDDGIFIFSLFHPVNYLLRTEKFDWTEDKKFWVHLNHYDVDIYNWHHPLGKYYDWLKESGFGLLKIVEAAVPKEIKGWSEEKYRIPTAMVFKLKKKAD